MPLKLSSFTEREVNAGVKSCKGMGHGKYNNEYTGQFDEFHLQLEFHAGSVAFSHVCMQTNST